LALETYLLRIPIVCRFCIKNQENISIHLTRVCMKTESKEKIDQEVSKSRDLMIEYLCSVVTQLDKVQPLIKDLEKLGGFVINKPEDEQITGPLNQSWDTKLRKGTQSSGLYQKHPLDCDLLAGFGKFLRDDNNIPNFKQEVANVSRFLFYMDSNKPSLDFVNNLEKSRSFFTKLADIGQKKQTIANYMKNLKRFLRYIIAITSLIQTDRALFEQCKHFLLCLNELQKSMSKQVSKEITGKRYIFQIDPHRNLFLKTLMTRKQMRASSFPQPGTRSTTHPITYKGFIPSKYTTVKRLIVGMHERYCYDKWRSQQVKMRRDYVIGTKQLKYPKLNTILIY
uniref:Uncharacterized protein n=1 Tax=Oncorhynchus tshawytscha TaxID=74940 RepID=A0AAZ3RA98_ONCTS